MGAGALTAAVAALEQAQEQAQGNPQLATMLAAQSLVSSALETGLQVAIDLQRPPGIASDEEMVELVDQVRDVAPGFLQLIVASGIGDATAQGPLNVVLPLRLL